MCDRSKDGLAAFIGFQKVDDSTTLPPDKDMEPEAFSERTHIRENAISRVRNATCRCSRHTIALSGTRKQEVPKEAKIESARIYPIN